MRGHRLTTFCALVIAACGGEPSRATPTTAATTAPTTAPTETAPTETPPIAPAVATTTSAVAAAAPIGPATLGDASLGRARPVVFVNDGDADLELDVTFGAADPITLAPAEGPSLGFLTADSPDGRACACPCEAEHCIECEPPLHRTLAVPAHGRATLEWNGLVRRYRPRDHRACFETPTPVGTFVVAATAALVGVPRAADGQRRPPYVAHAVATFPADTPIELRFEGAPTLACPLEPALLTRAASAVLDHVHTHHLFDDRLAACAEPAACVAENDIAAREASAVTTPCSIFVTPIDHELRVRFFAPLPPGRRGGEHFDHFLDVDATELERAHYEQ